MERITVDLPKDWLSVTDICEYMDVSRLSWLGSSAAAVSLGSSSGVNGA